MIRRHIGSRGSFSIFPNMLFQSVQKSGPRISGIIEPAMAIVPLRRLAGSRLAAVDQDDKIESGLP
jgi:hypothetical protein